MPCKWCLKQIDTCAGKQEWLIWDGGIREGSQMLSIIICVMLLREHRIT